jgi:hypothetical protein
MKNLLLAVAVLPFRIAPAFASEGHESEPGHQQLSYPGGCHYVPLGATTLESRLRCKTVSGLPREVQVCNDGNASTTKLAARNFRGYGFLDHRELDCSVQGLVSGSNLRGARGVRRRAQVRGDRRYWPRPDSADQCGSAPRT